MKFQEKIRRLVIPGTAARLEREHGFPKSTLNGFIKKSQVPLATKGIRLARVLGVSAEWLFDDVQEWPPPPQSALIPPFPIHPLPPDDLTWAELQQAVSEFVTRRAFAQQAALEISTAAPVCAAQTGDPSNGTDAAKAEPKS